MEAAEAEVEAVASVVAEVEAEASEIEAAEVAAVEETEEEVLQEAEYNSRERGKCSEHETAF